MIYKIASVEELTAIWDKDIRDNPHDTRYIRWKQTFMEHNADGACVTFVAVDGIEPVAQLTLLLKYTPAMFSMRAYTENGSGYVMAVRIEQRYEGQGHIGALFRCMQAHARTLGLRRLIIGVETREARTLAIYRHLGFDRCIGCGDDILWLEKTI